MPPAASKVRVLVRHSTSAEDQALAKQLLDHLRPLETFANLDVWSEARIRAGDDWRREVERAIGAADVALLLLSADFLASDALLNVDVPQLQRRHASGKLRVIPVLLRSCLWRMHPWLKELHPLPKGGKPLASFSGEARDAVLTDLAEEIIALAMPATGSTKATASAKPAPTNEPPPKTGGDTYNIQIHGSTIGGFGAGTGVQVSGVARGAGQPSAPPATVRLVFSPRARVRLHALLEDAEPGYRKVGGMTPNQAFLRRDPLASLFDGANKILRREHGIDLTRPPQSCHDTKDACNRLGDESLAQFVLAVAAYLAQVDQYAAQMYPHMFEARVSEILAANGSLYRLSNGTYAAVAQPDAPRTESGTKEVALVYLSYGDDDLPFARRLFEALEASNAPVFFRNDHRHRVARPNLREYEHVILVSSERSLSAPNVMRELKELLLPPEAGGSRRLISVWLDDFGSLTWDPRDIQIRLDVIASESVNLKGMERDLGKFDEAMQELMAVLKRLAP